jgi:23S rRNA U2552 (ribose-2'-O)-methylase RlmE/FtsJ
MASLLVCNTVENRTDCRILCFFRKPRVDVVLSDLSLLVRKERFFEFLIGVHHITAAAIGDLL